MEIYGQRSALAANAPAQQTKPDFTGTWKINLSKSKFPQQHGPARTGDIYKINHSGPKLEMEHLFSSRSETHSYVTDEGSTQQTDLRWMGSFEPKPTGTETSW